MQVVSRGKEYLLTGSDREQSNDPVRIIFCHKTDQGVFINGMTSEEIMQMLIDRQQHFLDKDASSENIQTLLYLKKALDCMTNRNKGKMNSKRTNGDSARNGISVPAKSAKS